MTIFLIGLPWLALVVAAVTDHKEGNDGAASAVLVGSLLVLALVLVGFGMGAAQ